MRNEVTGAATSLTGAALLAACACGTSSGIARVSGSFGYQSGIGTIHPSFVAVAGVLIVTGLWLVNRRSAFIALGGMLLLLAGDFLAPPMSLSRGLFANSSQVAGLLGSLLSAALLVFAFFRAFPSVHPRSSLMAMSGAAMATGCNCCLITMGMTSLAHSIMPSELWLMRTLTVYIGAAILMSVGLARIGGPVPAATAVLGVAFNYFWLELPYSSLPQLLIHGVNANFVIKYLMMLTGGLITMYGFALAFRSHESRSASQASLSQPAFGD
jgi:hypothetical protein